MAEYNMQELNLPGEDGKRILYPRMKLYGQVDLETITEKIRLMIMRKLVFRKLTEHFNLTCVKMSMIPTDLSLFIVFTVIRCGWVKQIGRAHV